MVHESQATFWHDCPDATTARGWFHAVTGPWSDLDRYTYTSSTMPVDDEHSPTGWREQSSIGNYCDYGPFRDDKPGPHVHAICYLPFRTGYFHTVADAKAFVEQTALEARPWLVIQQSLLEMEMAD